MPYNYTIYKRILHELSMRLPDFKPVTALDYGAGLGSGVWAIHKVYGDDGNKQVQRVAAVEPNMPMRKLGKFLSTDQFKNDVLWVDSLAMVPLGERGKFDLIVLGFVLQEVPSPKARQLVLEALWQRLREGGVFVVVEPGSPKGFRFIHSVREWAINDKSREEANVVAPCPHMLECPLARDPNSWCHFSELTQKYPNKVFSRRAREIDLINEKYSYMAIKKGETPAQKFSSEFEANTPEEKSFFWQRLIRPVYKRQRHSIMDLCTTEGEIERRIIAKSHGIDGGSRKVKRLRWGDLWYFERRIPNKYRKERRFGKRLW